MNEEQFCQSIQGEVYANLGLSQVDYMCKMTNINAFLEINRKGLENGRLEKQLRMYRSLSKESIFIEYPGKESTEAYVQQREGNVMNPYDFRPELHTEEGEILAKLSFDNIIEALEEYSREHDVFVMQQLSALIIRLAYMKGYTKNEFSYPSRLITVAENNQRQLMDEQFEDTIDRYYLLLDKESRAYLNGWDKIRLPNRKYDKKLEISIEGFLYYIDLLAQQEDCKYYYLKKYKGVQKYNAGIGRINNMLTLVNIINSIISNRPYDEIRRRIANGVKPIGAEDIENVTGGIIQIIPNENSTIEKIEIGK